MLIPYADQTHPHRVFGVGKHCVCRRSAAKGPPTRSLYHLGAVLSPFSWQHIVAFLCEPTASAVRVHTSNATATGTQTDITSGNDGEWLL